MRQTWNQNQTRLGQIVLYIYMGSWRINVSQPPPLFFYQINAMQPCWADQIIFLDVKNLTDPTQQQIYILICLITRESIHTVHTSKWMSIRTVRGELIPLKHSDTQHILLQVFDEELAVWVPFRVQRVLQRLSDVTLRAHRHLTVRVTLPCIHKHTHNGHLW